MQTYAQMLDDFTTDDVHDSQIHKAQHICDEGKSCMVRVNDDVLVRNLSNTHQVQGSLHGAHEIEHTFLQDACEHS